MKRVLSLILAAVMVVSMFAGMQINSSALVNTHKNYEEHEHSYMSMIVEPKEYSVGYTLYRCSCGAEYKDNYTTPKGVVKNLSADTTEHGVYLYWSAINDVTGYQVQILNSDGISVGIKTSVVNSANFTNLYPQNYYTARVRFYIKAGDGKNYFSSWSNLDFVTNNPYTLPQNGQIGESVYYTFDYNSNILTISGTGGMETFDYFFENNKRYGNLDSEMRPCRLSPFNGNNRIERIIVQDGVTSISSGAFQFCTNLKSVLVSGSVKNVNYKSFDGCTSLTDIRLNNGISSISYSFTNCTALKNISIPESVSTLCGFNGCSALESINIPSGVNYIRGFDGCTALKSINIPENVKWIGSFKNCKSLERVILPYGIKRIEGRTFDGCESLKSITIPESVTYIGGSCFNNCYSLEEIELPEQLTEIKNGLFYNCKSLKEINLPSGIEKVGDSAFLGCESLKTVRIPEATQTIKNCVFSNCKSLENVYIGSNCSSIGYDVFTGCNALKQFEVSENNGTYNDNGNALNEAATHNLIRATASTVIPNDTLTIENAAFSGLNIESVSIPASVISIGQSAFSDCKNLKEVNINDGLSNIAYGAFEGCINLSNIDLPESVSNIESHAFWNCPRLKNVTVNNGDCNIADDYKTFSARAVISGGDNSTAFCYAMNYNRTFRLLNHSEHTWVIDRIIPAKLTRAGKIIYYCAVCDEEDTETIASPKTFTIAKTSYVYTGRATSPAVTVKDSNGNALIKGKDYTVDYKNNINVGTASAVITFTGNYEGTKTLTFTILPKATKVTSATAAKKAFTAKWGKVAGVTGYQLQYGTNAKFAKATTKTIKGAAKYSLSVKSLKGGAKYYVRVRTYRTIAGKNYYSAWSSAKSVKTK